MKIAAFDLSGRRRHGLVIDDQVCPLPANTDIFKILTEDSIPYRSTVDFSID